MRTIFTHSHTHALRERCGARLGPGPARLDFQVEEAAAWRISDRLEAYRRIHSIHSGIRAFNAGETHEAR